MKVRTEQVSFTGTVEVHGELDLADALHLDQALAAGAEQLKLAGSAESLDARRATALGEMSRTQLALSFEQTDPAASAATGTTTTPPAGAAGDAVRAPLRGRPHRGRPGRPV